MVKTGTDNKKALTPEQKAQLKKAVFVKVVQPRVVKALKAIRLVGNCASSNYSYTREQRDAIIEALTRAVVAIKERYEGGVKEVETFSLPK